MRRHGISTWTLLSYATTLSSKMTSLWQRQIQSHLKEPAAFLVSVNHKMFRTTDKSEEYSKALAQFSIEENTRKLPRNVRVYSASRRTAEKFVDVSFRWQLDVFLNEQQNDQGRSVLPATCFAFPSLKDGIQITGLGSQYSQLVCL
jgi:hypothetical protein